MSNGTYQKPPQGIDGDKSLPGEPASPRERLRRALTALPVDRTPISFWQHFPEVDGRVDSLVDATLGYQAKYRLDLIKLMPSGMYSVVDYGAVPGPPDPSSGARGLARGPIESSHDFERLAPAPPNHGSLGAQIEVARMVRQALPQGVPVIDTVFSPLTMAAKLAGRSARDLIDSFPAALHRGLERLAEDCATFALEDLKTGIDGFFYAVQWAEAGVLSPLQQQEFGTRYDMEVLRQIRPQSEMVMLHLHGPNPNFELASQYDVDWVNWEDTETPPSLAEALLATTRGLAGGITRAPDMLTEASDEAIATIHSAIAASRGSRLLLAPGCVLPQSSSPSALLAIRAAVESGSGTGEGPAAR